MILVKIGPRDFIVLEELESVGWSSHHHAPIAYLKGGRFSAALDFQPERESDIDASVARLVSHLHGAWRDAMGFPEPLPVAEMLPAPEREIRDLSPLDVPMIEHDWAGTQHLDDPVRKANCRICTPRPSGE